MSETRRIKFKTEWDGFDPGYEADFPAGIADAYVNFAQAAEYIDVPPPAPITTTDPPAEEKAFADIAPPNKAILRPGKHLRVK